MSVLKYLKLGLFLLAAAALIAGFILKFSGLGEAQDLVWGSAAAVVLLALLWEILGSLRRGEVGLDLVAALSMSATLFWGETLAAVVVALMYSGGQLLEEFAENHAQSELKALVGRMPSRALRYDDGHLKEVPIEELAPGQRILVRQGEVVPVDGRILQGKALLDQSALTGESAPVKYQKGDAVMSGAVSLDMAFDMEVMRSADESTYSAIVRLVKAAQEAKAPMVRIADRFAIWFLLLTVSLAAAAWFLSGSHERMLAVLVSATPCPLILAVPVAIISGISKIARRGMLIKGGPVLERLARASSLVIDKTGTLTEGRAVLINIEAQGEIAPDELLRLAASLDQASGHVIAASLVSAALEKGLELSHPHHARETAGNGVEGEVDGHRVIVGGTDFVRKKLKRKRLAKPDAPEGSVLVAVAIDGKFAGHLVLADAIRKDARQAIADLRGSGIGRIVLASGDRRAVTERVGKELALDEIHAELEPEQKVAVVLAERKNGVVLMAGDGVNDAPALAAADVGIAMGARGSPASAEAADAVLIADNLERIGEAVTAARRSRSIALQSVYVGLGLSLGAMVAAAFGFLGIVPGAIFQEVIDVAVILNALRALR